ncbi:MAG: cobalamin B12-binding domain-containing protein [Bacteroidetes bacterium]|nr:cobalamin B12-binding domain-containing protein [Bacteroidota bacterium]
MQRKSSISGDDSRMYLAALLRGDTHACATIVRRQIDAGVGMREIFLELFQDALYSTGKLWEMNRISVATEHLATSITLSLFHLLYPMLFAVPRTGKSAIITCTPNEHHYVGARMVADICELHGWNGYFVGANTPIEDLCHLINEKRPDVLAVSLTLYSNLPALLSLLEGVRTITKELPIVIGGQGFSHGGVDVLDEYDNVTYHGTLDAFETSLDQG